jgi:hypothetical protein
MVLYTQRLKKLKPSILNYEFFTINTFLVKKIWMRLSIQHNYLQYVLYIQVTKKLYLLLLDCRVGLGL